MTARIVMPMLSAMPTPTIMLSRLRQRFNALRSGYGRRRARLGAAAPRTSAVRAGARLSVATGGLESLLVEEPGLVGQMAKCQLAGVGRSVGVVVVGVRRQTAVDQIGEGFSQTLEGWRGDTRRELVDTQQAERNHPHDVRGHLRLEVRPHELGGLHAADKLSAEDKSLVVEGRIPATQVVADDAGIVEKDGKQERTVAHRQDAVAVNGPQGAAHRIGADAVADVVEEPQSVADQGGLEQRVLAGVLVLDPLDRVVDLNPAAERMLGRTATAAIGRPLSELLAELSDLIDGAGPPADRHEITLGSAAQTHHYEVRVSALRGRDANSPVTGRVIVLADITLRKAAEESVRASHQFIQEVIANAGEGIVVYDRELRLVVWNPFMQRVTGLTAEQVIGQRVMDLQPDLTGERTALLAQAMDGATVRSGDLRFNIPQTGESGWYVTTYAPRRDAGGHPDGVICILHDITDRKRAEEVLSHRAMHDALTDLPNRALFQSRLGHAIRDARRAESGLALLVIDLDRFKDVNDTLGHGSGDRLLQELAVRWQALLQDGDTLARLGGDEFAVVLPTASGRAAVSLIAAQLQGALDCAFVLDGHSVEIGASIGIAMFPEHGRDIETLLRHADGAMYAAKRSENSKAAVYAFDLAA